MAAKVAAMGLLLLRATLIVAHASEDDTFGDKDIVLFFLCTVGGMFMASSKALTLSFMIPSFCMFLLPFRNHKSDLSSHMENFSDASFVFLIPENHSTVQSN
jgi:hypothetical protein